MYTLIENPKTNYLIEAFQSNEIKFAFANYVEDPEKLQLLMPWIKCREYFNELLMVNNHPEEFSFENVHGFEYDHKNFPLNKEEVLLAIKFPSVKTKDYFINNLNFIHTIEEFNKVDKPTTYEETSIKNVLVVKASKFWQSNCLLLNIYTLLIKLLTLNYPTKSLNEISKAWDKQDPYRKPTELNYVYTVKAEKLDSLLQNLTIVADAPVKYVDGSDMIRDPYTVHGSSGLLATVTYVKPPQGLEKFCDIVRSLTGATKYHFFLKDLS